MPWIINYVLKLKSLLYVAGPAPGLSRDAYLPNVASVKMEVFPESTSSKAKHELSINEASTAVPISDKTNVEVGKYQHLEDKVNTAISSLTGASLIDGPAINPLCGSTVVEDVKKPVQQISSKSAPSSQAFPTYPSAAQAPVAAASPQSSTPCPHDVPVKRQGRKTSSRPEGPRRRGRRQIPVLPAVIDGSAVQESKLNLQLQSKSRDSLGSKTVSTRNKQELDVLERTNVTQINASEVVNPGGSVSQDLKRKEVCGIPAFGRIQTADVNDVARMMKEIFSENCSSKAKIGESSVNDGRSIPLLQSSGKMALETEKNQTSEDKTCSAMPALGIAATAMDVSTDKNRKLLASGDDVNANIPAKIQALVSQTNIPVPEPKTSTGSEDVVDSKQVSSEKPVLGNMVINSMESVKSPGENGDHAKKPTSSCDDHTGITINNSSMQVKLPVEVPCVVEPARIISDNLGPKTETSSKESPKSFPSDVGSSEANTCCDHALSTLTVTPSPNNSDLAALVENLPDKPDMLISSEAKPADSSGNIVGDGLEVHQETNGGLKEISPDESIAILRRAPSETQLPSVDIVTPEPCEKLVIEKHTVGKLSVPIENTGDNLAEVPHPDVMHLKTQSSSLKHNTAKSSNAELVPSEHDIARPQKNDGRESCFLGAGSTEINPLGVQGLLTEDTSSQSMGTEVAQKDGAEGLGIRDEDEYLGVCNSEVCPSEVRASLPKNAESDNRESIDKDRDCAEMQSGIESSAAESSVKEQDHSENERRGVESGNDGCAGIPDLQIDLPNTQASSPKSYSFSDEREINNSEARVGDQMIASQVDAVVTQNVLEIAALPSNSSTSVEDKEDERSDKVKDSESGFAAEVEVCQPRINDPTNLSENMVPATSSLVREGENVERSSEKDRACNSPILESEVYVDGKSNQMEVTEIGGVVPENQCENIVAASCSLPAEEEKLKTSSNDHDNCGSSEAEVGEHVAASHFVTNSPENTADNIVRPSSAATSMILEEPEDSKTEKEDHTDVVELSAVATENISEGGVLPSSSERVLISNSAVLGEPKEFERSHDGGTVTENEVENMALPSSSLATEVENTSGDAAESKSSAAVEEENAND